MPPEVSPSTPPHGQLPEPVTSRRRRSYFHLELYETSLGARLQGVAKDGCRVGPERKDNKVTKVTRRRPC